MQYDGRIKDSDDVNGDTETLVSGAASGRGGSKASQVVIKRKPYQGILKVGTWNVRTMLPNGKLENVIWEMEKAQLNIVGLIETRWRGNGDYISEVI